jgi:hypothetical protein
MANAQLKTQATEASVEEFLSSIDDERQREDSVAIDRYMQEVTGERPKMWGTSIIGYGQEHLKYESGRELDWMKIGFSPRKQNITLYILRGGEERYRDLLSKLGRHKTGKGCLYIKRLSDIDTTVLKEFIKRAVSD